MVERKRPYISVINSYDPARFEEFHNAAMERHIALFKRYGIEPVPAPSDKAHPSWQTLALALAEEPGPGFNPRSRGRPQKNEGENITWWLASQYFRRLNNCSVAKADDEVARHFGVDPNTVRQRLKAMRKKTPWKEEGLFSKLLDNIEAAIGREKLVDALAPRPIDPALQREIAERRDWLDKYPYN